MTCENIYATFFDFLVVFDLFIFLYFKPSFEIFRGILFKI